MFHRSWAAAVLVPATLIVGLAGCGGADGESSAATELTLELVEQNSSGQEGTATFAPLDSGDTRIVLELTNPPEVAQPAHVHAGTCDNLGDPVVTLTDVERGRSETETEMSLEDLQQGDFVIHAHKSETEYDVSVACAPIARG